MKTIYTIALAIMTLFATNSFAQETSDLVKEIMKTADVSEDQAKGGTGALFGMAQENMTKEDFGKVSDVVPDMGGLLEAIPSTQSSETSMLGTVATQVTGMPKVVAAFDKLGISQDKVALFTPVLVNYVENKGGKALGGLLGKALE